MLSDVIRDRIMMYIMVHSISAYSDNKTMELFQHPKNFELPGTIQTFRAPSAAAESANPSLFSTEIKAH